MMARNRLRRIEEGDFSPRVSAERHRGSLSFPFSPLLIVHGLSRKNSLYRKLRPKPLKLSVLKLDGSCFDIEVKKAATIAELKQAVEAVFGHMPQKGPGKISWLHVWAHFCLCYDGQKLVTETDSITNYGIKDGDQLHFIRHISISYNLRKIRSKKRAVGSKQHRMSSNGYEEEEHAEEEGDDCDDIEKGKLQCHKKNDKCLIGQRKSRTGLTLGGWFLYTKLATIRRRKIVALPCPSGIGTGLVGGFRKFIWLCKNTRYSRRDTWREA